MGAMGESVHRVTDLGFNPAWSPDGRRVLYRDTNSLVAIDIETKKAQPVLDKLKIGVASLALARGGRSPVVAIRRADRHLDARRSGAIPRLTVRTGVPCPPCVEAESAPVVPEGSRLEGCHFQAVGEPPRNKSPPGSPEPSDCTTLLVLLVN